MLNPISVKLACGHSIKLIPVPLTLEIKLFGATEAFKQAAKFIRKEARGYCCADYVCRASTGKPTHFSL